ncbi:MAG: hypothetical protein ABI411_06220 [Tahibacter sp.]
MGRIDPQVQPAPKSLYPAYVNLDSIALRYSASQPILPETVSVRLDQIEVVASCTLGETFLTCLTPGPALSVGKHTIDVSLGPLRRRWWFRAVDPPKVAALLPVGGTMFLPSSRPVISGRFSDPGYAIDRSSIKLTVDGVDVTQHTRLHFESDRAGSFEFVPERAPSPGNHVVHFSLLSRSGLGLSAPTNFVVEPQADYSVQMIAPEPDSVVRQPDVTVQIVAASNRSDPDVVTMNGQIGTVISYATRPWIYSVDLRLVPGANAIRITVQFQNGEIRTIVAHVIYEKQER